MIRRWPRLHILISITFFELPQIKSYKYSTKKTLLTNLRNIFRFAKKHYGIVNDPFFKMAPLTRPVATEAKKLEIVSKRDFKTLFDYAVTSIERERGKTRHTQFGLCI